MTRPGDDAGRNGTVAAGISELDQLTGWLSGRINQLPGGRCPAGAG
ncbi:hypothetical protein [Mycobacterium botniense]|nr:hypothetical protein [Mycobacterium botniense]